MMKSVRRIFLHKCNVTSKKVDKQFDVIRFCTTLKQDTVLGNSGSATDFSLLGHKFCTLFSFRRYNG